MLEGTYTLRILENFFDLLFVVGPYLLISIGLNAGVSRYFSGRRISFSKKSEMLSIGSAALIGLVSPLPTYAAIPIGLSLVPGGVPLSAVLAFVVSSPLMNPSIFFLTATQLGIEMAVARTLTAFLLGVCSGICVMKMPRLFPIPDLSPKPAARQFTRRTFPMELYRSGRYASKYFSIALLLSAAVKALIPSETVVALLGSHNTSGTLIAIAMGVPFYSCGGAAIPFMQTLMNLGMSKGATLAFFTAGPATKIETLYAFKSILGIRMLVFYLAVVTGFSFLAGSLYGLL